MQGKTISHFQILEFLGRGGMGVVYKALDLALGRTVALKFLPASLSHDEGRQRFLHEARAASRLNHPNICTIHEIGEGGDGQLFLCLELCEGETLKARLERCGLLPLGEALDVAIQIASALARAHEAGIVHRDIKPGNIVVDDRNQVKVLDFGLALMTGETRLTRAGSTLGTVAYMSPEQIRGDAVDPRSDLWSLGVVLFEMLTGSLPFEGPSPQAVLYAVINQEPTPLAKVKPDAPHVLDRVLARLLAKDPAARIASAQALEQELRQIRQEEGSEQETRTMALPLPPRTARRRPLHLAVVALIGLAALAGLAFSLRGRGRNEAPQSVQTLAVLPFDNLTGDPSRAYFGDGVSAVLISKLSEVPGLNVVSRSETWSYKGSRKGARQIAKELGAQKVLEGQVMETGDRIRVNATLVDGETGFARWSRNLEGGRGEIFQLQDRLAREVVQALSLAVDTAESRRLSRQPTASLEAYDFYLRGKSLLDSVEHPEDLDSAAELLRKAIAVDANFALAHADLAEALSRLYWRDRRNPALVAEARRQAERAIAIDPHLLAARIARAAVDRRTGRVQDSIRELASLVALHPESDPAWLELAVSHDDAGDLPKAEMAVRQAIEIRPDSWYLWNYLGALLQNQGNYAAAREAYERAIETTPSELSWPQQNLASMETLIGNCAAAIEIYERVPRPIGSAALASNIGNAYYCARRLDEAEEYFRLSLRLQPKNHSWHRNLADLLRRRGDVGAARAEYRVAAQLVGKDLEVNPGQGFLQLRRALYLAEAGSCGEALPVIRYLEGSQQPNASNSWDIALAYAVCGQRTPAVAAIRRAVANGHSAASIPQQDEFKPLLSDPALAKLAAAVRPAPRKD